MEKGKERGEFFLRKERIGEKWKVVLAGEAGESKSGAVGKVEREELVLAAKGGEGR
ncbi:MAG: hypothetical protein KH054_00295 [Firmicutes bacterium]|jgi:hypothetical protein|nr:hypothetical protein [Bacillota bacterium]